jgi:hypothetical protein
MSDEMTDRERIARLEPEIAESLQEIGRLRSRCGGLPGMLMQAAVNETETGFDDENRPANGPERIPTMSSQAIVATANTVPDIPLYPEDNRVSVNLDCQEVGSGKETLRLWYEEGVLSQRSAESMMQLAAASATLLKGPHQYAGKLIVHQEAEVNGVRYEQGCAVGVLTEPDVLNLHEANAKNVLERLAAQRAKHH